VLGVKWMTGDVGTRVAHTGPGERLRLTLADSSSITLGPASTLRYSIQKTARRVELTGLASFTVTHDPNRPFIVRAGNAEATDLGTAFVVRAYSNDSTVEVAVSSGRVQLAARGDPARGIVAPATM
jgi:transmembrane sensor